MEATTFIVRPALSDDSSFSAKKTARSGRATPIFRSRSQRGSEILIGERKPLSEELGERRQNICNGTLASSLIETRYAPRARFYNSDRSFGPPAIFSRRKYFNESDVGRGIISVCVGSSQSSPFPVPRWILGELRKISIKHKSAAPCHPIMVEIGCPAGAE